MKRYFCFFTFSKYNRSSFVNQEKRNATLTYAKPLTAEEMSDYELRPSRRNLDVRRTMDAQAQVVGAWEVRSRIPEGKRLTWWCSDFGSYAPGDLVPPEQLAKRYRTALKFPRLPARSGPVHPQPRWQKYCNNLY